jgi:hypothetical protein
MQNSVWLEKTVLKLKWAAVLLTVMCPILLAINLPETLRQAGSAEWPSVEGRVIDVVIKPWLGEKKQVMQYGRVLYTYQVNGKECTTDLTDLGPGMKRPDEMTARMDVAEYRPGMSPAWSCQCTTTQMIRASAF